jgi:hypothetical protein
MGALLASGSHAAPVLMQQMAMFFAQFRPSQANLYRELITRLDHIGKLTDTAFASLNYECLLELSIASTGRSINYFNLNHGSANTGVAVWKLHGSCNFLPGPEVQATRGVSFGAGAFFNTSVRAVDPGEVTAYCIGDTALYPAMAHFAPGKTVQIAQPVIQGLQEFYADAAQTVTSIAVIGVRPNIDDHHVWDPLAATPGEMLVVGDKTSTDAWAAEYRNGQRTQFIGNRFETSVADLVDEL